MTGSYMGWNRKFYDTGLRNIIE